MKITYLGNSGFALERDGGILVVDCYDPQKHTLLSDTSLAQMRYTTALVSHVHRDHYSPDIWNLNGARFAAGFDVPAPVGVPKMRPGQTVSPNGMHVTAYGSTDEGVSFHIVWDGVSVFHAGDLNDWHWRDEGGARLCARGGSEIPAGACENQREHTEYRPCVFPRRPAHGQRLLQGSHTVLSRKCTLCGSCPCTSAGRLSPRRRFMRKSRR